MSLRYSVSNASTFICFVSSWTIKVVGNWLSSMYPECAYVSYSLAAFNILIESFFQRGERTRRPLCGCIPEVLRSKWSTGKTEHIQIQDTHKKSQRDGWVTLRLASNLSVLVTDCSQSQPCLELTADLAVSGGTLHHADGSLRASSAPAVWLMQRLTQSQAWVSPAAVVLASNTKWSHISSRTGVVLEGPRCPVSGRTFCSHWWIQRHTGW